MALVLNEDWTADVVGQMHKYRITNLDLADECVYYTDPDGNARTYTPSYLSVVLNGKKELDDPEKTKGVILAALDRLIKKRLEEVEGHAEDQG